MKNGQSDTPETDYETLVLNTSTLTLPLQVNGKNIVPAEFARKLERERNRFDMEARDLRKDRDHLRDKLHSYSLAESMVKRSQQSNLSLKQILHYAPTHACEYVNPNTDYPTWTHAIVGFWKTPQGELISGWDIIREVADVVAKTRTTP